MSGDQRKSLSRAKEVTLQVSEELVREFVDSLPRGGPPNRGKRWSPEEDAKLLAAWPTCNRVAVAKALGCCYNTALNRYRELTELEEMQGK